MPVAHDTHMQYYAMLCSAVQYYAVLCSTMQYYAVLCYAVPFLALEQKLLVELLGLCMARYHLNLWHAKSCSVDRRNRSTEH